MVMVHAFFELHTHTRITTWLVHDSSILLQFSRQDGVKHIEVWIVSAVGSQGLVCQIYLFELLSNSTIL